MISSAFWAALAITLVFSSFTASGYFLRFRKTDVAIATILYGVFIYFIVHFVAFDSSLGLGIGLLGILSMVRLRSTAENLMDIGMIFYAITVGLLGASIADWTVLLAVNGALSLIVLGLVCPGFLHREASKIEITLDEIDLKMIAMPDKLSAYIERHYSLKVRRIVLKSIDHLKDSVSLLVYYDERLDD
ncbi:DUF4956 domain-containing protein [Candidatus Peregrinibacteria bacterium]|nr:MAG: DUF4956 domain-containing protein [Candidatus Peregrinibacteria bacterium]